jgi:hypothetical protein
MLKHFLHVFSIRRRNVVGRDGDLAGFERSLGMGALLLVFGTGIHQIQQIMDHMDVRIVSHPMGEQVAPVEAFVIITIVAYAGFRSAQIGHNRGESCEQLKVEDHVYPSSPEGE